MKKKNRPIRFVALFLAAVMTGEQGAHAAEWKPAVPLAAPTPSLELPRSAAIVDDAFRAPSSSKTVYLIQDAHTNSSAQANMARALDSVVRKEGVRAVFLEGGSGDDSLSFLRGAASAAHRARVAKSYLLAGEIGAAEYLDVTSDLPIRLWGVEDRALYDESVAVYRAIAARRESLLGYLDRVNSAVEELKSFVYNSPLLAFDRKREVFSKGDAPLTGYFDLLSSEASKRGLPMEGYPQLAALRRLSEKEKKIDFAKANEEQRAAAESLSEEKRAALAEAFSAAESPFKVTRSGQGEARAFYAVLEETLSGLASFPELAKYVEYLKEAERIDFHALLDEQKSLEDALYRALARTDEEARLHRADEDLDTLRSLLSLTLTPDEFDAYRGGKRSFDIAAITGFLNRSIFEHGARFERVVFLERGYGEAVRLAERFYELTYRRDEAMVDRMTARMDALGQKSAALVAGGYHSPNLKEAFKRRGISYVSVTPRLLHETDRKRYEKILFGRESGEAPAGAQGSETIATLPMRESPAFEPFVRRMQEPSYVSVEKAQEIRYVLAAARLGIIRKMVYVATAIGLMSVSDTPNPKVFFYPDRETEPSKEAARPVAPPADKKEGGVPAVKEAGRDRKADLEAFRAKIASVEDLRDLARGLDGFLKDAREKELFPDAASIVKDHAAKLLPPAEARAKEDKRPPAVREAERAQAIAEALRYSGLEEKDLKGSIETPEKAIERAIRARADYAAATPEIKATIDQIRQLQINLVQADEKLRVAERNAADGWRRAAAGFSVSVRLKDSIRPQENWPKDYTAGELPPFASKAPKGSKEYQDDELAYARRVSAYLKTRSAYEVPKKGYLGRDYLPYHATYLPQYAAFGREKGGKILYFDSVEDVPAAARKALDEYADGPKNDYHKYDPKTGTLFGRYMDWRFSNDKGELIFGVILEPPTAKAGILKYNLRVLPGSAYKKGSDKQLDLLLDALKDGKARTVMGAVVDEKEIQRLNDEYNEFSERLERMNARLKSGGFRQVIIPPPNFKIEDERIGPKQEKTGRKIAIFYQQFDPSARAGGIVYLAYPTDDIADNDFTEQRLDRRTEYYKIYRGGIYSSGTQGLLGHRDLDYGPSAVAQLLIFRGPNNLAARIMLNQLTPKSAAEAAERMGLEGGVWRRQPGLSGQDAKQYLYPQIPVIGREAPKDLEKELLGILQRELEEARGDSAKLKIVEDQIRQLEETGTLLRPNGERYSLIFNPEDVEETARRRREARDEILRQLLEARRGLRKTLGLPEGARLAVAEPPFSETGLDVATLGASRVLTPSPAFSGAGSVGFSSVSGRVFSTASRVTTTSGTDFAGLVSYVASIPDAPVSAAVPGAGETADLRAFVLEVLGAVRRQALDRPLALAAGDTDAVRLLEVRDRADLRPGAVEVTVAGSASPIVIEDPAAELQARRSGGSAADQKKAAVRGFIAALKMDRLQAEREMPAQSAASPYAIGVPMSLLKTEKDPARFEAAVQLLIAQVLELKSSPRYAKAVFFLDPAGLDGSQRSIFDALVEANRRKGHDFLETGDASGFQGVFVKFVDTREAKPALRDGRTVTLPVSADDSSFFFWSRLFVIGQATAAVFARPGVYDREKNAIDDREVSAGDFSGILSAYNKNAASPVPDAGRFLVILRSESDGRVLQSYSFQLPPVGKLLLDAIYGARLALQAIGGSA